MSDKVLQFGNPFGEYIERPGVYAVIYNEEGKLLIVQVSGKYHLPGGGVNPDEDLVVALEREVAEETGYGIRVLKELGAANQFYSESPMGPINKNGRFYLAKPDGHEREAVVEKDHESKWLGVEEFLGGNAPDFQKWAVTRARNDI